MGLGEMSNSVGWRVDKYIVTFSGFLPHECLHLRRADTVYHLNERRRIEKFHYSY